MNSDPGLSENGDEEEVAWNSASVNLKTKIDLVQEILARLECTLTAVTRKKNELEEIYKARLQTGNVNDGSFEKINSTLLMANEIIQVIGESLNQYCAFDNVLRTVEENRHIEENVVLLFPTLSKLDKVITHFQRDKIPEWNAIKQRVQEFNSELNRVNSSNVIPVMSRLLQVKLSTSGSSAQTAPLLSENNISHNRPTGKRPLNSEDINTPPEKLLKLSCNKSDAVASAAIQSNPLDLIKNLCHRQGHEVIEVVDYGVSEENRIIGQTNSSDIQNGDPNRNANLISCSITTGLPNYGNNASSASTPMQSYSYPNNLNINYAPTTNAQFTSTNVSNSYGRDNSTNIHLYNINQPQFQVCSSQSQVSSSINQSQVYNNQSVNNNQPNFYNSNNLSQDFNNQSQPFNNSTQSFSQLGNYNGQSQSFTRQSFNINQSQSFNNNQSRPFNNNQSRPFNNNQSQHFNNNNQLQSFSTNQSQLFNSNQSQLFNSNQSQPFNSNQSQPFNSNQSQPFNSNQSQPFNSNQSQPFNSNQSQPFNNNNNQPQSVINPSQPYSNQSNLYNNQSPSFNNQYQFNYNQPKNNSLAQLPVYRNCNLSQVSYNNNSNQPGVSSFPTHSKMSQASTSASSVSMQSNRNTSTTTLGPWYNSAGHYAQGDLNSHTTNYETSQKTRPNIDVVSATPAPNTSLCGETTSTISNLRNILLTRNGVNSAVEDEKPESNSTKTMRPSVIQKSPRKTFTADSNTISTASDLASSSLFKEIQDLIDVASLNINGSSSVKPVLEKLPEVITIDDEDSLAKLNLKKTLVEGIHKWGLSVLKPFQIEGIKALVEGKDIVLHCNYTGGKTTLAIIAVVQNVNEKSLSSQAIILTASKEDSLYIHERISNLGALTKISPICVDNTSSNKYRNTKDCGQVIVGMPKNVLSFLKKHNFRTETVLSLIIDSADELLEYGGVHDVMKILYVLNGNTQVSMMVRKKTETVVTFSKRLRNPIDIESPPIEETEDAPINSESPPPMTPTSDTVDEISTYPDDTSTSTIEIPCTSSCSPQSELVFVQPKYVFKVKSILKHISLVEVTAELPNGEEVELELKDECSENNEENLLDPEEDPLALTEPDCNVAENELDPEELARRLKAQNLLQKNPNFYMAFPEDIQKTLNFLLPKYGTVNEERKPPQVTTIARKVSCTSEQTDDNLLMDREEFLKKKHYYVVLDEEDAKIETLSLFNLEQSRAIIFCHNCEKAEWLSTKLRQKSMFPQVLHKYTSKKDRDTILKTFEMEVCRILVTTDNVLTNVHNFGVPLVINYDMPAIPVNYFWRSRFATQSSVASSRRATMIVSFIQENNLRLIHHIKKTYGVKIVPMMEDRCPSRASSVSSTVEIDCETPD